MAAAVIGGTSIMGGRGGYGGTIVGALILTVLTSLLSSLGYPEAVRQILFGSIIVAVAAAYTRVTASPDDGGRGAARAATRHLGLDLGGTNLKWVVVEHADGTWTTVDRGQVPTRGPDRDGRAGSGRRPSSRRSRPRRSPLAGPSPGRDRRSRALRPRRRARSGSSSTSRGRGRGIRSAGPSRGAVGLPAFLINDARAFGLAELRLGAGRGASSMVGLTLGTGVGGVIAIDGRVHQGHDGTAGEIGHQTIDPDGPWCGCGNRGCLEAFARADQIAAACGTRDRRRRRFARPQAGDARAIAGLAEVGRYLGIGIANMIIVITPDRDRPRRRRRGGRRAAARRRSARRSRGASGPPPSTRWRWSRRSWDLGRGDRGGRARGGAGRGDGRRGRVSRAAEAAP